MHTFNATVPVMCWDKTCADGVRKCPYLTWGKWMGAPWCELFTTKRGESRALHGLDATPRRCRQCLAAEKAALAAKVCGCAKESAASSATASAADRGAQRCSATRTV